MVNTNAATYSDETTTGRTGALSFRDSGRATIAARVPSECDLDWIPKLMTDHLGLEGEMKAATVLPIVAVDKRAREFALSHANVATILIVDLSTYMREMLDAFLDLAGIVRSPGSDPMRVLRDPSQSKKIATNVLRLARAQQLNATAIPRVESMLIRIACDAAIPLQEGSNLFDNDALMEMTDAEFQELVVRFAVAFADALDPQLHAETIVSAMEGIRYVTPERVAYLSLEASLGPNRVFDKGNDRVFEAVEDAHKVVVANLEAASRLQLGQTMQAGGLSQEDSRAVLGLQAADLAAGIAAEEFERYPRNSRAGAEAVRSLFSRVFLNDEWI